MIETEGEKEPIGESEAGEVADGQGDECEPRLFNDGLDTRGQKHAQCWETNEREWQDRSTAGLRAR